MTRMSGFLFVFVAALFGAVLFGAPILDATSADEPPAGQAAYDKVCKVCHGEQGKGGAGPTLVPFERDVEDVIPIVREGTGQMPPISEERISDEAIAQVVAYLKSLSAPAAAHQGGQ